MPTATPTPAGSTTAMALATASTLPVGNADTVSTEPLGNDISFNYKFIEWVIIPIRLVLAVPRLSNKYLSTLFYDALLNICFQFFSSHEVSSYLYYKILYSYPFLGIIFKTMLQDKYKGTLFEGKQLDPLRFNLQPQIQRKKKYYFNIFNPYNNMEALNRQQRRQAERLLKKQKVQLPHYQIPIFKPLIQAYPEANAIQLNFRKKNIKDIELLETYLKPLTFIANELETKWMVILRGAEIGLKQVITKLTETWEFPTLINNSWMKKEKFIQQYFGKGSTFKKMQNQCVVCLESKHLKFLWCCGINICYKCEAAIKVKQCPICRHPMMGPVIYSFPKIQELEQLLPNCQIITDQLNGSTSGLTFENKE